MFEIWECVIVNEEIEPLIFIDKTDDIQLAKQITDANKNYIIWDKVKNIKI